MKLRVLFIVFAIVFATVAYAPAAPGDAPFGYDELKELIASKNVSSTAELLRLLPKEIRSNFTLVYQTRNTAQFASVEQPRAILSSKDGTLLLAVSGARGKPGYNTVEVIEYKRPAKGSADAPRFEFHSIAFDARKGAKATPYRFEDQPKACVGCHAGRPNWDVYPEWPGVFGSHNQKDAKEEAKLKRFLKKYRSNDVYRQLIGVNIPRDADPDVESYEKRNVDLTDALTKLNFERVFQNVRNLPEYRQFRAALVSASVDDDDFLSWIPGKESRRKLEKEWQAYRSDAQARLRRYYDSLHRRLDADSARRPLEFSLQEDSYEFNPASKLGFVLSKMGYDLRKDAMPFERNSLAFAGPIRSITHLRKHLVEDVAADYPKLRKMVGEIGALEGANRGKFDPLLKQLETIQSGDLLRCVEKGIVREFSPNSKVDK